MAGTEFPLNHPQARKKWAGDLFKEALKRTYAMRFMGTGSGNLCQVRSELKDNGDRIRVNLRVQLSGRGVVGDSTLEGNEEALTIYHDDIYIDQFRHAVRSAGKMSEQRVPYSVRNEARDGLADFFADRYDYWFFNQLAGNTTETDTAYTGLQTALAPTDVILAGSATSTTSLSSTHVFDLEYIDYAQELARTRDLPMRGVRVGGKEMFVLFIHEYQATDLRRSFGTAQWGDIQKAALMGGKISDNPIFTGALGVYNNTILHATTRLPTAGGVANTRRAVFCGAQAASIAFGKGYSTGRKYDWNESMFDYGNQLGVAAGSICGLKKLQFNSMDMSVITIPTYAAKHTS